MSFSTSRAMRKSSPRVPLATAATASSETCTGSNTFPSRPTRCWRNRIGPSEVSRTASAMPAMQWRQHDQQYRRKQPVEGMLDRKLPPVWVHRAEAEKRKAAQRLIGDAIVDRVEHPRHHRYVDPEPLTTTDKLADSAVGCAREGNDHRARARCGQDVIDCIDRAEHGRALPADPERRSGVVVDEADRQQAVLGMRLESPGNSGSDNVRRPRSARLGHRDDDERAQRWMTASVARPQTDMITVIQPHAQPCRATRDLRRCSADRGPPEPP